MSTSTKPMAKAHNDVSVKIDAEVYRTAKTVAASKNMRLSRYISLAVARVAEKDWERLTQSKIDLVSHLEEEDE